MIISIGRELEAVLSEQARRQGVAPEELALAVLQDRFLSIPIEDSRDDWERQLRRVAVDCGVSLSDATVSSEGIYE